MQYRTYGRNGPDISRLGFGVMRLPQIDTDDWSGVDFERSVELLRAAFAAGVNFVDSHHTYHGGNSETAIGLALKDWRGGAITIQTKTPWYREEPLEFFEKMLYEALEKLGVDCIDYLLHHSMRMTHWETRGAEFIRFTDWAMNRGLIRHRGFSSHETPENVKAFIDTGEFSVMLVSYNWMNPQMRDTIAYAADRGMGVTIMNPVGGGALATSTTQIMKLMPDANSAAEIAMRYVLNTPGVTCALSGMNTAEQLAENVRIAGTPTPLTAAQERDFVHKVEAVNREAGKFCTACGYCMPCPHGVDIAGNFKLLNQVRFYGRLEWARKQYARLKEHAEGDQSAVACQQCGSCEPKCPNDVPIMKQLEEVAKTLG